MGQANASKSRLALLKAKQVYCFYCGVETFGTTIDHMPPISIFRSKDRPKGMEFLACHPCNSRSSPDEQVAALLSRLLPDATKPTEQNELIKILSGVGNNHPGLLEELKPRRIQSKRGEKATSDNTGAFLNAKGPLLNRSILRFGAKLGLLCIYTRRLESFQKTEQCP